jgi:hypothetical protein
LPVTDDHNFKIRPRAKQWNKLGVKKIIIERRRDDDT